MRFNVARALITGGMLLSTATAADATNLSFTLTGLFDLNLGGNAFDNVQLKLKGTGYSPLGLTTVAGDPFINFTSLKAVVTGFGTFAVPSTIIFYFHPGAGAGAGEGGFLDTLTGKKVLILNSPAFTGYDGQSGLSATGLLFESADGFETPFGAVRVGNASNLALSTAVGVPELASWAMFIGGFGLVGTAMRRRPRVVLAFT